jgi:hypothetical protein
MLSIIIMFEKPGYSTVEQDPKTNWKKRLGFMCSIVVSAVDVVVVIVIVFVIYINRQLTF